MAIRKIPTRVGRSSEFEAYGSSSSEARPAVTAKSKKGSFSKILFFLLILAVAILGYAYYVNTKVIAALYSGSADAKAEASKADALSTEAEVKKLALVPTGEVPQIIVISNAASAISLQPSLAGVIDGDKVLVYVQSAKAYVYSPSRKILVNILPLSLQGSQATTTTTSSTTTVSGNDSTKAQVNLDATTTSKATVKK